MPSILLRIVWLTAWPREQHFRATTEYYIEIYISETMATGVKSFNEWLIVNFYDIKGNVKSVQYRVHGLGKCAVLILHRATQEGNGNIVEV